MHPDSERPAFFPPTDLSAEMVISSIIFPSSNSPTYAHFPIAYFMYFPCETFLNPDYHYMESLPDDPSSPLQSRSVLTCQPQNGIALRIATFFVLSVLCHAATLHSAPGQGRLVIFIRSIGMIFSPVTAGLYSLMALGRMGLAWVSIAARTIELLARIMAPEEAPPEDRPERRHTLDSNAVVGEKIDEVGRRNSAPDLRGARDLESIQPL